MQEIPKTSAANGGEWLTGQVLIAMPSMGDARFVQSVIFLCAHSAEGAMGVALNRPVKAPKFAELMRQLKVEPQPPQREIALGAGGPVEESRGFVLHSADWRGEGSMEVDGTNVLSANLEVLRAIVSGGGPRQARLLLGYSGWGAGQLETEIRENAWLNAPADEALLYDTAYTTKWQRALAKLKITPGMLSGEAGRA
jgi:putative transcriptional regulator